MITDTIVIKCDTCGQELVISEPIPYRISGLSGKVFREARTAGWGFRRNRTYELQEVTCPGCRKKNNDGA